MFSTNNRKTAYQDLTGRAFGRLTAVEYIKGGKWLCLCSCGKKKSICAGSLRSGDTKSCGCLNAELARKRNRKHGGCVGGNGPEFRIWSHIKTRTLNPKSKFFNLYGGRGIKICDRWCDDFEAFILDMGHRPTARHSIDRIDNNGDYTPNNCRWATMKEQSRNRSSNVSITFNGKTMIAIEWAEALGINYKTFHKKLRNGWSIDRIVRECGGGMR